MENEERINEYIKQCCSNCKNGGKEIRNMKWTKQKAEEYIKKCKEKGLKYWSAKDYLKNHKTMTSII